MKKSIIWAQILVVLFLVMSINSCSKTDDDIPKEEEEETEEIIMLDRPLLGVQRWDMYSGKGTTQGQELGYKKYETLIKSRGEEGWKEWVQAYLACMVFVDDQIGRVVEALNNSPYSDNTIIVLTSDNGYQIGEKDIIQKWHLWNESTRIPLYVSIPNSKEDNLVCNKPVSLIDLYPTLADICQLSENPIAHAKSKKFDGKSLVSLLKSPEGDAWEYRPILSAVQANTSKIVDDAHFSVIDDQYRYTLCLDGEEELYDHKKDPNEWHNLAKNENYVEIKKSLNKQMKRLLDRYKMMNLSSNTIVK